MADKNQKIVQVGDDIISFPAELPDEHVNRLIQSFRAKKNGLTTEESEKKRQLKPAQPLSTAIPTLPSWATTPILPKIQAAGDKFDRAVGEGPFFDEQKKILAEYDKTHPVQAGINQGIQSTITGMTTPVNLGLLAAAPESKILSAYFALQAAVGSYRDAKAAHQAYKEGKNQEAANYVTQAVLGAAMAGVAGAHAASDIPIPAAVKDFVKSEEGSVGPQGPVKPAKIDKNVESEPGYAYHATNEGRLHEIADTGKLNIYKPNYGTDQESWPDGSTKKRAYFTPNAGSAWQFSPEEGSPVIVRTKSEGLGKENTTGDLYSSSPIPTKNLEYLGEDKNWHPVDRLKTNMPDIQMARTAEGKVKLGADAAALGKILGSSLYKSEGAKVITKELVQNAMDAVRQSTGDKNVTVELFDGTYPPAPMGKIVEHPESNKYYGGKYAIQNPNGSHVMEEDTPSGQTPVVKPFDSVYRASQVLTTLFPQGTSNAIRITDTGKGMTKNELETVFTDLGASGKRDQAEASGGFGLAKAAPLMMSKELNVSTVVNEDGKLMRHSFTATPEDLLGNGVDIKSEVLPKDSVPTGTTVTSVLPPEADIWGARHFVTQSNISLRPPGKMKVLQNGEEITPTNQVQMDGKPLASRDVPGAKLDLYTSNQKTTNPAGKYGGFSVEIHNNGIFQFAKHVDVPEGVRGLPARAAIDVRATVPEGHPDYPFTANREELRGNDIDGLIRDFVKKHVTDPIAQAHKQRISDMYWNFPYINDSLPVFDSGMRFEPKELQEIISNPAVKEIADNILMLTSSAKNLLEEAGKDDWRMEGYGARTQRVGLVFSDDVHGVHITNPEDKKHATIFINPFDKETNNPDEYASLIWHTIKHELVHDNVSGHNEDFTTGEKNVARALGKMEIRALNELRNSYADPNDSERVRPDFDRAFQLYKDSRRREKTTPDIFRGEESRTNLDKPEGKKDDARGIQSGREGTVPAGAGGIKWSDGHPSDEAIDKQYPKLSKDAKVDGRVVRQKVPNQSSIDSSSNDPNVLPGIREVQLSEFPAPPDVNKRTKALADEIKQSGEINPLIVMIDKEGPYILEGGHRYDALKILGAKSFPAMVVIDEDDFGDEDKPTQVQSEMPKEEQTTKYKYGNTQADIPHDSEAGKALSEARSKIDKDDLMDSSNTTDGGGLEENSHVTVRYGIDGDETAGIKSYLEKQKPFEATLGKTIAFPASEHSDGAVPIVAPIESPDLHRMEKEIDQHGKFKERSFPDYKPHATLAYVKPGTENKYVGMDLTHGKKFTIKSVSISDRNGDIQEVPLKGKDEKKASNPALNVSYTPKISLEEINRLRNEIDNLSKSIKDSKNDNKLRVKSPDGMIHYFKDEKSASNFRREAGIQ